MAMIIYVIAVAVVWWLGMMLTASGIGGMPFILLALLGAGLKLAGIIDWEWWWTLLALWGALGGGVAKMWLATRDPMWRHKV